MIKGKKVKNNDYHVYCSCQIGLKNDVFYTICMLNLKLKPLAISKLCE